jgi:hypothetical protein
MTDFKTSLLVNRQLPEFVRDEYPLFQTFLEAYYEFLENEQGSQNNDLITQAKNLRNISDVDASIADFETSFFNTFASLVPREVQVTKEFLIKNVLPLYLAKGSEKAFKLLFRLLFNDEVEVILPKNNILRASDGKWTVDNIINIETDVRSIYTANGNTSANAVSTGNTTFYLAQEVDDDEITVYVNDVLKTHATDYYIRKEAKKLIFNTAPTANAEVRVVYSDFEISLLNNRKVTGVTSGATALIENAVPRIITDQLNFGLPFELFVDRKSVFGTFNNGEIVRTNIIGVDNSLITIEADTFSTVTGIRVVSGGASYNIGDPVTIVGGGALVDATAEVSSISTGFTSYIVVNYGGAGFGISSIIRSSNIGSSTITGAVDAVNTSHFTANTFVVNGDLISNYANVVISDSDYGFLSPISENVATRIVDALTPLEVSDIGPITNAIILFSDTSSNDAILDSEGAIYEVDGEFFDIKTFNSIGRIDIINGGTSYNVGDEVVFGTNPAGTYGLHGAAAVKTVDANGTITTIQIQPPRIDGTANILNNTNQLVGTNTIFEQQLQVGDKIVIASQERFINAISSNTSATVNVNFQFLDGTSWANNIPVGSFAKGLVGGVNYTQNIFPTLTVSSRTGAGSGANVEITSLMGDGEDLNALSNQVAGQILAIRLTSGGAGYEYIPQVDLSNLGDGSAIANAQIGSSFVELPGRWTTSDSIISSTERKLQGSDFYIDYSYITSSITEFSRYKNILFELLHPAGFINYAFFNKESTTSKNVTISSIETVNTISGLVAVSNASVFVTGTGTLFNVANTRGILTIGSNVSVNGEIRVVNSIISNTNLQVTSAFTTNANSQTLIILT